MGLSHQTVALLQSRFEQLAALPTITLEKYRSRFTHLFNGETEHLAKSCSRSCVTKLT